MIARQLRSRLSGVATGLGATLVVALFYGFGLLDWIELKTLDLRFQYANSIPQHPLITMVDIDDESLRLAGRWPWSRDTQAAIVRELTRLSAQSILFDINWVEPEPLRTATAEDLDIVADPTQLRPEDVGFATPDLALAESLRHVPSYLAVLFDEEARGSLTDLSSLQLRERVSKWIDEHQADVSAPQSFWPDLFRSLSDGSPENETTIRSRLSEVVRDVLNHQQTRRMFLPWTDRVGVIARRVRTLTPIYFQLAAAGRRCGFVVFEPDNDKVVRRQAIFAQYDGLIVPQIAVQAALDQFRATAADLTGERGRLTIRRSAEPLVIQLDASGHMLIPWVAGSDYTKQFRHVPVGALWQIADRREKWFANRTTIREATATALRTTGECTPEFEKALARSGNDDFEWSSGRGAALSRPWDAEAALRRETSAALGRIHARLAALTTQPYERHEAEADALKAALQQIESLAPYEKANAALNAEIEQVSARLQNDVFGKICLFGYTATALADMTPTPTHKRVPGVMAHANILNGFLTGRTVSWLRSGPAIALSAAFGILATLLAVSRRPRETVPGVLLLTLGYVGWAAFVFYRWAYWLPVTPVIGSLLFALVAVSLYQYAFVDRERRQLAAALSQYTSKAIARQMAENPELCKRAETREVTTVFTDLRGFTQISERIGADRTQKVLNVCLGRFTDVFLQHEAMINKFIGDGIFAFWNPVIFPQEDHAVRACETAVDLIVSLRALVMEQKAAGGDATFADLELRVGVATGNAVVGPCGSEQKYDYTCIGDSVNVSSRLESANKFFGTKILVSGGTRDAVGERFAFRPLGGVRVKGKQQAVPVYELLGRASGISEADREYAALFGRGVACFQRRDWAGAATCFSDCLTKRPDDLAASAYADIVVRYRQEPPGEGWLGAIELSEK